MNKTCKYFNSQGWDALREMKWKLLCFRFGIFVVFSLWLQSITWTIHHVPSSLIRSQRLLSCFEVSCPISCSLFLYCRNFSYPHKHNVIQTAEVTTALGWQRWASPLPFPGWESPLPLPHSVLQAQSSEPSGTMAFPLAPSHNWKSDSHSIYTSASVLPHSSGDTGVGCWLQLRLLLSTFLEPQQLQDARLCGELLLHLWHSSTA